MTKLNRVLSIILVLWLAAFTGVGGASDTSIQSVTVLVDSVVYIPKVDVYYAHSTNEDGTKWVLEVKPKVKGESIIAMRDRVVGKEVKVLYYVNDYDEFEIINTSLD